MQNFHDKGQSNHSNSSLLLGSIGLLAGTAWCLKHHTRLLSSSDESSGDSSWVLALLGAGLAGAAVGAAVRNSEYSIGGEQSDVRLASQVIIDRPPEEVYHYWKDFRNLPQVMNFIEQVKPLEGNKSHWVAQVPLGPTIEWDSEVVDDDPGRLLSWRSLEGSELMNWGRVTFSPSGNGRGTELFVAFNFTPPENMTGTIARFLSDVENASLDQNLINLKSHLESEKSAGRQMTDKGKAME